jgi:hypothetical protein
MPLKHTLLAALFGVHWIAFVVLLVRTRRASLILPIAVFTLLVLVQLLWDSAVMLELGPLPHYSLRTVLRTLAIVLAVPSVGLMGRRIVLRRRGAARASA